MPKLNEVGPENAEAHRSRPERAGKLRNRAQPLEMTHATRIRVFQDPLIVKKF